MNRNGYFQIEAMIALILFLYLFVLSVQILYNITNESKGLNQEIIHFEAFVSKIEYELKFSTSYTLSSNQLSYVSNGKSYSYYKSGTTIMMKVGNTVYGMLFHVVDFKVTQHGHVLQFEFTRNGEVYQTKIIINFP